MSHLFGGYQMTIIAAPKIVMGGRDIMKHDELTLITGDKLAKMHGYNSVTSSCRYWWKSIGIEPLPGRKNIYDPRQVSERLDLVGRLRTVSAVNDSNKPSLTEQRRARKNAQG
jgi:hypothetical protein